jgi:acyl-[acyl-carrier-protein] desaturase
MTPLGPDEFETSGRGYLPDGIDGCLERLLERHESMAKSWYPHEFAEGANRDIEVPAAVRSALFINLLTEDGLPYYTSELEARLGRDRAWGEWSRRWTAEEARHSIAIREWVHATAAIDPYELERARMAAISHGLGWHGRTLIGALVYVAVQELATRTAHRRTGDLIPDASGQEMLRRVSADENLHFLLYRDVVAFLLATEPALTLAAVDEVVRGFRMPGTGIIPDFRRHATAAAAVGIYNWTVHVDHVLEPLLRYWRIDAVDGVSVEAEQARASIHRHVARLRRASERVAGRYP